MKRSLKRTGGRADTPTKRADALNTPAELEADRRPRAEGCLDRGGGVLGLPERGCLEGDADKRRSAEQEALLQEGAAVTSRSRCYKKEPLLQAAASVTRTCGQASERGAGAAHRNGRARSCYASLRAAAAARA